MRNNMSKKEEKPTEDNVTAEEAQKKFDELSVEEKVNVITQNAMSRQECLQRLDVVLEKIQALALKVENLELKQRLAVVEGDTGE
jgi:hypothetical protein